MVKLEDLTDKRAVGFFIEAEDLRKRGENCYRALATTRSSSHYCYAGESIPQAEKLFIQARKLDVRAQKTESLSRIPYLGSLLKYLA